MGSWRTVKRTRSLASGERYMVLGCDGPPLGDAVWAILVRMGANWTPDVVVLDELPEPPRTHRTSDLIRLAFTVAVMALLVVASSLGSGTTEGLQEDIRSAVTTVPSLVVSVLATLNNLIVLALPIYLVVELVIRRRWRLLFTALSASALAAALSETFLRLAPEFIDGALLDALTLPGAAGTPRTAAAFTLFAAVAALMTAEGQASRTRTTAVVWGSLIALGALFLVDRRATPLALTLSVLGGHVVGLIVRYVAGTENPRVPGRVLAAAIGRVGLRPVSMRQLVEESDLGRRFHLEMADGTHAQLQVFDPDRRAAELLRQVTRLVRVRAWVTRAPAWSERSQVQQMAVPVLMAKSVGVRTPALLAAVEVEDRTMAIVTERPAELRPLSSFAPEAISDDALRQLWTEVRRLHHAGVAHEDINPDSFMVDNDGKVWLVGLTRGEIAASRLRIRLDRAELLIATAMLVGSQRALDAAVRAIGAQDVAQLPPLMQKAALNRSVGRALKAHPDLLADLRDDAIALTPTSSVSAVRLVRLRPRSVVSIVALTFAVYVLAGQLGDVNFDTVFTSIDWWWAGIATLGSLITYFGSAWTISPFSPVAVSQTRWLLSQFAATFVTLVAPAAVGSAGTNVRVIQQAGAPPALAFASVGVSTLIVLVTTVIAFAVLTIASAENPAFQVSAPSPGVLIVIGVVLAVIIVAFVVPASRRVILERLRPTWENTGPRLLDVLRSPRRMLAGIGGSLLTTVAYAVTLYASVRAYGADIPMGAAAVVYLASGILGSVAPTPGGIGAVEAALVAGLSAVGVPGEAALPAALLYRTVTFWLPVVPGWFAFQWLQNRGAI